MLRVDSISELFDGPEILAKQPRPKGRRLTIVTNAGGPGVLATDALHQRRRRADRDLRPRPWRRSTPSCPRSGATTTRSTSSATPRPIGTPRRSRSPPPIPNTDGLLVILTPQAMTDPTATAEALVKLRARSTGKPVLASWMGGEDVAEGAAILREAGIPTFAYPDTACVLFNHLWRYADNLRALYETPRLPIAPERGEFREEVDQIIADVAAEGRTLLTEYESKKVLAAYGIPITDTELAADRGRGGRRPPTRSATRSSPSSSPDDHPQDRRRRRQSSTCATPEAVREAFDDDPRRRSPRRPAPSTSRASRSSR